MADSHALVPGDQRSSQADDPGDHNASGRREAGGSISPRAKQEIARHNTPDRDGQSDDDGPSNSHTSWRDTLRNHPWIAAAALVAIVLVLAAVLIWWLYARQFEITDDAFIDARTVALSSQVAGAITQVDVTDNRHVKTGDVVLRIDPRDYVAKLDQSKAQVSQAAANVKNLEAQIEAQNARIEQADKQVTEARAALKFSQQENARYQDLLTKGAGTAQRAEQASSDLQQKRANFDAATAAADAAHAQIDVLNTQKQSAAAKLDGARAAAVAAQTNLDRTVVKAPVNGLVTKLTAAKGAYASPGQTLLMIVPDGIWVTANFKETQLALMKPGQPVTVEVDAYPGHNIRAHVDSIQAGSGTAFSLLPAENATGNYVKIVQRVPVKIVFDEDPKLLLGPGMSVVPRVRVR